MISELTNANIEVLLVAAPHHPYVYPHLDEGQMDGFNHTIDHYGLLRRIKTKHVLGNLGTIQCSEIVIIWGITVENIIVALHR